MNSLVRFCIFMVLGTTAGAFAPNGAPIRDATALKASRKEFFEQASAAGLALVMASAPAFADDGGMDDLSMPSEEEQQKAAEAAMAERLRKKAELQKAASKPVNFKESMEVEKKKQESLKKSKEERRNALCEELGRGC